MKRSGAVLPVTDRSSAIVTSDVGPRSIRWLAELCGLPQLNHLPHLASEMVAQEEQAAKAIAHIAWWARHPEVDSNFARLIGGLPDIPDAELFEMLKQKGYEGLLYESDGEIIGHCFFQQHDTELHAFSVWVSEPHRGGILMAMACFDFMAYASARPGVVRARFGTGHPGDRLLRPLKRASAGLGWRVRRGAWVDFHEGDLKIPKTRESRLNRGSPE